MRLRADRAGDGEVGADKGSLRACPAGALVNRVVQGLARFVDLDRARRNQLVEQSLALGRGGIDVELLHIRQVVGLSVSAGGGRTPQAGALAPWTTLAPPAAHLRIGDRLGVVVPT